jgi:uncharacterized membrane protein
MKTKTITPMGALHPILFFAGVYVVVLLFSIFICSSLFYSCNSSAASLSSQEKRPVEKTTNGTASTSTIATSATTAVMLR